MNATYLDFNSLVSGLAEKIKPGTVSDIIHKERVQEASRLRLTEFAKKSLEGKGMQTASLDDTDIIKRAVATTDFPDLFQKAINLVIRKDYETRVQPWQMIARKEDVKDFREKTGIKIDGTVTFDEIPEGGLYQSSPILYDEKATLQLKKFGRVFNITYQALINDDMGVIARIPKMIMLGAEQFQSEKVWGMLFNNAKTPDGKELFHTGHNNYKSTGGSVISPESLSEARVSIRRQTTPDGKPLGMVPKFLIVPPELQTKAEQLVTSITATKADDVNVFSNGLEVIVCDLLTDKDAWYLAADPNEITADGLIYSYLDKAEGANVESVTDFNTDGLKIKASLAFGTALWGYQGWYKNAGK